MKCYCDRSHGGAGKMNTPYTYHLYLCEFYLDEIKDYSYEEFVIEYEKMEEQKKTQSEIYAYFSEKLDNYYGRLKGFLPSTPCPDSTNADTMPPTPASSSAATT